MPAIISSSIQIKIDTDLKNLAQQLFEELGMSLNDAIKLFLKQSINANGLPFIPKVGHAYISEIEWELIRNELDQKNLGKKKQIAKNSSEITSHLDRLATEA